MRTVSSGAVALSILSALFTGAAAQDLDPATSQWFDSLKQPVTGFGCCSSADCRPVRAHFENGAWVAETKTGRPGETVVVPEDIIVRDKVSPFQKDGEGLAILCEANYAHAYSETVTGSMGSALHLFCYVVPPNFS